MSNLAKTDQDEREDCTNKKIGNERKNTPMCNLQGMLGEKKLEAAMQHVAPRRQSPHYA
jgi:hypothetical protein